jgi:hypothetical protein
MTTLDIIKAFLRNLLFTGYALVGECCQLDPFPLVPYSPMLMASLFRSIDALQLSEWIPLLQAAIVPLVTKCPKAHHATFLAAFLPQLLMAVSQRLWNEWEQFKAYPHLTLLTVVETNTSTLPTCPQKYCTNDC